MRDTPTLMIPRHCARCCCRLGERDSLVAERDALAERNERLHYLLQKLRRMQFGPRSERLPEDQLQFAFEELEAAIASGEAEKRLRCICLSRRRVG